MVSKYWAKSTCGAQEVFREEGGINGLFFGVAVSQNATIVASHVSWWLIGRRCWCLVIVVQGCSHSLCLQAFKLEVALFDPLVRLLDAVATQIGVFPVQR